jgi:XTP/dITP diphosphohydrolase
VASASSGSRPRLVVATLNRAKGRELVALLDGVPFTLTLLADVSAARLPEETGGTYAENALLKARAAARLTGAAALADDSGIEVDALGGEPGLRSARWGGADLDDAGRNRLLLERLAGVPPARRGARYVCVVAIVDAAGGEQVVEGTVRGVITEAPRGDGGFGYDPIFFYPPFDRTFGEVTAAEKDRVSHRGQAVRAARKLLGG